MLRRIVLRGKVEIRLAVRNTSSANSKHQYSKEYACGGSAEDLAELAERAAREVFDRLKWMKGRGPRHVPPEKYGRRLGEKPALKTPTPKPLADGVMMPLTADDAAAHLADDMAASGLADVNDEDLRDWGGSQLDAMMTDFVEEARSDGLDDMGGGGHSDAPSSERPRGLTNFGNSCYMNAAIQVCAQQPPSLHCCRAAVVIKAMATTC